MIVFVNLLISSRNFYRFLRVLCLFPQNSDSKFLMLSLLIFRSEVEETALANQFQVFVEK